MNPDATGIQVANHSAWQSIRATVHAKLDTVVNDEEVRGKSYNLCKVINHLTAIRVWSLMYQYVYVPLEAPIVTTMTLADAKERYDYETLKKCFACKGIKLDDYEQYFTPG